jgi:hypothetical protein
MRQYKVLLILIQVILCLQKCAAGFERTSQPTGVLSRAFSGSAAFSADHLWLNPATIAREQDLQATLFYSPSPFQLKQLSTFGASVTGAFEQIRLGGGLQSFGSSLYREMTGTLCLAHEITGSFSAGVSMQLYHLSIERYGTALRFAADVGFIVALNETMTFGSVLRNLTGTDFGSDDDIPQEFCSGITVRTGSWGRFSFDMIKDIRYPLTYAAGADVVLVGPVTLSIGFSGGTSILTGGLNIELFEMTFQYAVSSHQVLGLTHSLGVTFR